ncbi:proprotein convertase P-domain-containing protein [candidate division CSSED10-310 bacterium]|uniref:Proprotein convertase P-domain-containing protein n=1 Tax=candidate division CSSED10-310 bacterium TaxID=2855610 RepID=A0ABV6Z5C8_UNCC1
MKPYYLIIFIIGICFCFFQSAEIVLAAECQVTVDVAHSYIGDLTIVLITPSSQTVTLHDRAGGSTDNIQTTYTLNDWDGNHHGYWTLLVTDHADQDEGTLISWSVAATLPGGASLTATAQDTPLVIPDNDLQGILSYIVAVAAVTSDGITAHFRQWLSDQGYAADDFARDDLTGGSFGGRQAATDVIYHHPVIFIHGNSDKAIGTIPGQTGWSASLDYFLSQGYQTAELYATTWGPANAALTAYQYHSKEYLLRIRAFIQAVYDYTGTDKVDIIAHSMGVTLARKAIKGGFGHDAAAGGDYDLGAPLSDMIDTFVGIAGANQGLVSCYLAGGSTPTCSNTNGFYPGYLVGGLGPYGVSDILVNINENCNYEGDFIFTIWTTVDQFVGYGGLVYGEYTSQIPGQHGEKVFYTVPYGHFNLKDLTADYQWNMVKHHQLN